MSQEANCGPCRDSDCHLGMSRRDFLAAAAGTAAATRLGALGRTSSLFAAAPEGQSRPTVDVCFVRPAKPLVVSWPGGNCDTKAQQALFTKTLRDEAGRLDVELRVHDEPLWGKGQPAGYLQQLAGAKPDGLVVCAMCLRGWRAVNEIVQKRGEVPTIVYSNLSGFTSHLQCGRNTPGTFLGATQDVGWLAQALRMLNAIWRMKHARILVVKGNKEWQAVTEGLGTTFRGIPKRRFPEELEKVSQTKEVREIADAYETAARKIVEPAKKDLLAAAKNYIVCRRLMAAEKCHGISIDCLGWKDPVCVAFSKLLDEGTVATCEADRDAALSHLLTMLLLNRPGFMQDPSPNTVNNTLIGAHCTSPTKLEGFDRPYRAAFNLRNYHTRTGVSPQVLWPVGKAVTVMEFAGPKRIIVGTGRVRSNIPQPPSGCCRTAVEIELDGVTGSGDRLDTRSTQGFHQLFILGAFARELRAYGQLAGIKVDPICS